MKKLNKLLISSAVLSLISGIVYPSLSMARMGFTPRGEWRNDTRETNRWIVKMKANVNPQEISDALQGAQFEELTGIPGWFRFTLKDSVNNQQADSILKNLKEQEKIISYSNDMIMRTYIK